VASRSLQKLDLLDECKILKENEADGAEGALAFGSTLASTLVVMGDQRLHF
jgi:hypothetical protein